jgi:hypothetical protein
MDSANIDNIAPHNRHRKVTEWVDKMKPEWKLSSVIPNRYPESDNGECGSIADFYIYENTAT